MSKRNLDADAEPKTKKPRSASEGDEYWDDEDELTQICAAADEEQEEYQRRKKDKKEIYCVCVEGWCVKIFEDLNTELTHTVERVNILGSQKCTTVVRRRLRADYSHKNFFFMRRTKGYNTASSKKIRLTPIPIPRVDCVESDYESDERDSLPSDPCSGDTSLHEMLRKFETNPEIPEELFIKHSMKNNNNGFSPLDTLMHKINSLPLGYMRIQFDNELLYWFKRVINLLYKYGACDMRSNKVYVLGQDKILYNEEHEIMDLHRVPKGDLTVPRLENNTYEHILWYRVGIFLLEEAKLNKAKNKVMKKLSVVEEFEEYLSYNVGKETEIEKSIHDPSNIWEKVVELLCGEIKI